MAIAACQEPSQLMRALYYTGPISVYVKADCHAFQHYSKVCC